MPCIPALQVTAKESVCNASPGFRLCLWLCLGLHQHSQHSIAPPHLGAGLQPPPSPQQRCRAVGGWPPPTPTTPPHHHTLGGRQRLASHLTPALGSAAGQLKAVGALVYCAICVLDVVVQSSASWGWVFFASSPSRTAAAGGTAAARWATNASLAALGRMCTANQIPRKPNTCFQGPARQQQSLPSLSGLLVPNLKQRASVSPWLRDAADQML